MWKLIGIATAAVLVGFVIFQFSGTSDVEGGALPGAGTDTIDLMAFTTIEVGGPPEIVELNGTADIARDAPIVEMDGSATIDIELVALSLTGTSTLLGPDTPVEISLDPNGPASMGQISTPPDFPSSPAESFFDVYPFVGIGQFDHNTENPVSMQADASLEFGVTQIPFYKSRWNSGQIANNLVDKSDPTNIPGSVTNLDLWFGQPPKSYTITVLKLDADTGQPLEDFEFNLYAGSGCSGAFLGGGFTDVDGYLDFLGLDPGAYSVEEKPVTDWNVLGDECRDVDLAGVAGAGGFIACPNQPDLLPPGAGCDSFQSGGVFDIEINASGEIFSVSLGGPTVIQRGAVGDKQPNGLDDIDTEVIQLDLTGSDPDLGNIVVRQSPSTPSTGQIEEQENLNQGELDFPANSDFDVYFEVDVLGLTLHNQDPLHIECKIDDIPPSGCLYQPPINGSIDLVDDSGLKIAKIIHAAHIPVPPKSELVIFRNRFKTATPTPTEKQYSITVLKLDADTDDPLDSFEFNLYQGPGCSGAVLDSGFTDQDGYLDFLGLDPGSYSVEEKPKGGWNVVGDECQDVDVAGVAGAGSFVACPKPQDLPPPDAGCDSFSSGAQVNIEVNATGETFAVTLGGPTVIQRGAVGDKQPNGLNDIDTEIIQLDLTGSHPTLGSVVVRQSPDTASTGQIEEQENTNAGELDFPADSYFDIYFEVDVLGMTLHNQDSLRLECKIDDIPPFLCLYQPPVDDPIDLVDDNKDKIAKIVHGVHIPVPPKDELVIFRNREKDVSDVPGDVDCDFFLRSTDAALILQLEVGLIASLACPQNADLNNDGLVSSIDAAIILQCDAGLFDCSTLAGSAARASKVHRLF